MNPLLRMAGMYGWGKGVGDRFGGSETSDLKSLTDAYSSANAQGRLTDAFKAFGDSYKAGDQFSNNKSEGNSPPPEQSPLDRIKAAFESLKDMHKGPDQTAANTAILPADSTFSPFDNAHWPQGPVGAPSQAMGQAPAPAMPPRQDELNTPPENPMMSLFQRSAAMQQDPMGGGFIDPAAAAKARPGIFQGLF